MKKMDRVLINQSWLDKLPTAFAEFLAPGISDHSPALVNITPGSCRKGKTFHFYNYWSSLENFSNHIGDTWATPIEGNFQFQLCHKIQHTKNSLKVFVKDFHGKEHANVERIRLDLDHC